MTKQERALEGALEGFEPTGDDDLDAMVDAADHLTAQLAVPPPVRPQGRALFVEGVAARKRSILSSLAVPAMGVTALLVFIAVMGRDALPGEPLYAIRNVMRSAGLAQAPTAELEKEIDDAVSLLARAQSSFDNGGRGVERLAAAALMSLGRAEGYLEELEATDRVSFESRIDSLRSRAVTLIGLGDTLEETDGSTEGSGSGDGDNSGSDDRDGSGDDNSGSGSDGQDDSDDDNSGSDDGDDPGDDNSGSGSDGQGDSGDDNSGSDDGDDPGDDNSGSGSDGQGDDPLDEAENSSDERADLELEED